jgi:hypothetical protein
MLAKVNNIEGILRKLAFRIKSQYFIFWKNQVFPPRYQESKNM